MNDWRKPGVGQIAALRKLQAGERPPAQSVAGLLERRWATMDDESGRYVLTDYGTVILDQTDALIRAEAMTDRPDVRLRKRYYGRAWLGWEVVCSAGCRKGHIAGSEVVWFTNDHTARDKYTAEVAYARHVIKHAPVAVESRETLGILTDYIKLGGRIVGRIEWDHAGSVYRGGGEKGGEWVGAFGGKFGSSDAVIAFLTGREAAS